MEQHYVVNWAFGCTNTLAEAVRKHWPQEAHRWPILRQFDFEAYVWNSTHLVIVLKDKLMGIPTGPSVPGVLDDPDAPTQAPGVSNIHQWIEYLSNKYTLRPCDIAFVFRIVDQGVSIDHDWTNWSPAEQQMWTIQIDANLRRQLYYLKGFDVTGDFLIPPGYDFLTNECEAFFKDHPHYSRNVFIMTRFVPGNRLLVSLDAELRSVLRAHGLEPVRADDKMYMPDRNLWNNVCVYMVCCKIGIAILEDRIADEFNPNVALEYGFMRGLNKRALLLADTGFRNLRADVIGTLRETFDITDIEGTIKMPVERWLQEIGIASSP